MNVEICANSVQSAINAEKGGADRIELCQNLNEGGTTPSYAAIKYCAENLSLKTMVLIRPRPGDFCYNEAEIAEIERTILRCKALGVHAVVIGFLTPDGKVDFELTRRMVQLAAPMEVTFHRAFDEAQQDPIEALQAIMEAGCHRLLTSGQAPTAPQGAAVIKRLVDHTASLKILAGSGVTPDNVRQLIAATGVTEVHGSCKTTLPDGTLQTDATQVRRLISVVAPTV